MKRMKQHLAALLAAALLAAPLAVPADAAVYGDVDGDGTLGVLDVITLQKWIHGSGTLPSARAADLDRSGIVDIFDLAMVKNALFAEGISESSVELTKVGASAETAPLTEDFRDAQRKFAVELMQHTMKEGENVLVSPYSVMQALAMTDAGAVGDTRVAMDNALGGLAYERLAPQLGTYRLGQPDMLQTANSVWFRDDADRIQVAPAFLEECAGRFGASAFAAPFDQTTVDDINLWIRDRTARMIPHMLDKLSDDTVMALVNAVSFDAKWMEPYDLVYAVRDGTFTNAAGEAQTVPFMWSEEHAYLEDAHATGFLKYYDDGRYAFAAILPEEGLTPEAYLAGLDADGLRDILTPLPPVENEEYGYTMMYQVTAAMPKLHTESSMELKEPLCDMGMGLAFTDAADFSAMAKTASGGLCIGQVLHKTAIDVNEDGTRAAAATVVEMTDEAAVVGEVRTVILDRPYVYMIVDTENDIPLFIGTVNAF